MNVLSKGLPPPVSPLSPLFPELDAPVAEADVDVREVLGVEEWEAALEVADSIEVGIALDVGVEDSVVVLLVVVLVDNVVWLAVPVPLDIVLTVAAVEAEKVVPMFVPVVVADVYVSVAMPEVD